MKKLYFVLVICLLAVSCQREDVEKPNLGARALSNRITPYEAIDFAIDAVYDDATRGYNAPRATVSVYGTEQTRSGESVDTMFYFVNFENNGGYAIVSTDRRAGDVVAFSRSGNIDPDSIEEGSAMDMIMTLAGDHYLDEVDPDDVRDSIVPIVPNDYLDYPKVVSVGNWEENGSAGPFVEMSWNQYYPYNSRCFTVNGQPAPAGCTAIALAHIMSYYQYPESHNNIDYRWGLLLQTNPFVTMTEDYINHIGEVIADIGATIGVRYSTIEEGRSWAYPSDIKIAAEEFGFYASPVSQATFYPQDINAFKLFCVTGTNSNGESHTFVADGFIRERQSTTYIDYDMNLQDYYYYNTYSYRIYAHCNWGFGETAPEYCISSLIQPTGKLALYDFYHFYITL